LPLRFTHLAPFEFAQNCVLWRNRERLHAAYFGDSPPGELTSTERAVFLRESKPGVAKPKPDSRQPNLLVRVFRMARAHARRNASEHLLV
jgi:hypothetical protein